MGKHKTKTKIGVCQYHLCKKKTKVFLCKYCGGYFCKEHIKPQPVLSLKQVSSAKEPLRSKLEEIWRSSKGHPDFVYTPIFWKQIEEEKRLETERMWEVLDSLKELKKVEEHKETETVESKIEEVIKPKIINKKRDIQKGIKKVGFGKSEVKDEKAICKEKRILTKKIKEIFNTFIRVTGVDVYNFIKHISIALLILVLLHFFFVGRFGLLLLLLRSVGLVLLWYCVYFVYKKTKYKIPYKWVFLTIVVICISHILSTRDYTLIRIIDKLVGIPSFTNLLVNRFSQVMSVEIIQTPKSVIELGGSLFRYKTPDEKLKDKILEYKNNSLILEKKIHELVNQERSKYNLNSLVWDENLANIARNHSEDMARRNYFSHVSPSGENLESRYNKFGYVCRVVVGNLIYMGGENILLSYVYDSYFYDPLTGKITNYTFTSIDDTAFNAVESWMNSKGHRENILTLFWRKEGIGVYIDVDGEIYITQNFC